MNENEKMIAKQKGKKINEFAIYVIQYRKAIYKLINGEELEKYIYPILMLVYQLIENELKMIIVANNNNGETASELKIDQTHDLKLLIERQEFFKLYDEIPICIEMFKKYKESVLYFYEILGNNTFLKSRYPIEKSQNCITIKKEINYKEFYNNWTKYSLCLAEMEIMNTAYSYFNTVIYWKQEGKSDNDIKQFIEDLLVETFMRRQDKVRQMRKIFKYVYRKK